MSSKSPFTPSQTLQGTIDPDVAAASTEDCSCCGCPSIHNSIRSICEEEEASCCRKEHGDTYCCEGQKRFAYSHEKTSGCNDDENACCGGKEEMPRLSCGGENGGACCDGEEVKDSPCSCGDDENPCGGENCCDNEEVDGKENIDDDSVCMCCINVLINEPTLQATTNRHSAPPNELSNSPDPLSPSDVNDTAAGYLNSLRTCCQALVQYCVRRSCCFVSHPTSKHAVSSAVPLLVYSVNDPISLTDEVTTVPKNGVGACQDVLSPGEKLQLEIRGMDCVDCVPKVGRALSQLPSIASATTDYFTGTAELQYDPETISPTAIATYVARATGFSVKAVTAPTSGTAGVIIALPIAFSTIPPREAFDGFNTRSGPDPRTIEVLFPVHVDSPLRPREVLEQFKAFGAELVPPGSGSHRSIATRDLIFVGARTIACALLSIPVLVFAWADLPHRPVLYGGISVGLTTLIQALAFPIFSAAIRAVVYLYQVDMNVLVSVSTLMAYVFSVVSYACEVAGKPFSSPFFETNALLVTLIFLGRTVSAATRRSTGSALRELQRLQPAKVLLCSGETPPRNLDSRLLHYGDIIRIPPETRVATDGLVVNGSSDADESSLTGESVAVPKVPGSRVIAGTLNLGGTLDVQVTRLVHENSLAHITALVKQAGLSRSPIQDLSDKFSAVILPVAAASASIAFLVWVLVGRYARQRSPTSSSVDALTYAIAILIVSCPCAIGLVLPVVMSVAIRIGIHEGVLFRSAEALQSAYDIDVVAFDKTGTLTQGNFTIERSEILVKGAEQIILALVKDNIHPISQGVYRYLSTRVSAPTEQRGGTVTDIVCLPGKGIKAFVCGFPLFGGSPSFTGACIHALTSELQSSGLSLFSVTLAGQPIAFFGLSDTPRPGAGALVVELTRRGKDVMILSGDTPSAVQHLANVINAPQRDVYAALTPEEKDTMIATLQAKGKRVCFIGDGTNDGPALSRADISLAMAAGSDVALTAAGGVLLGSDLRRSVLAFMDIANAARMHAQLALAWCILYNIFAILLASGALVKVRIEPRWAGIGEVVSIVPVIAIAFGLDLHWMWRRLRLRMHGNN